MILAKSEYWGSWLWARYEKKDAASRPQASAAARSVEPSSMSRAILRASSGLALEGRPGVFVGVEGDGERESIYDRIAGVQKHEHGVE